MHDASQPRPEQMGTHAPPLPAREGRRRRWWEPHEHPGAVQRQEQLWQERRGGRIPGGALRQETAQSKGRGSQTPQPSSAWEPAYRQWGPGQNTSCRCLGRGCLAKGMSSMTCALPAGSLVGRGSAGSDSPGVGGRAERHRGARGERSTDMGFLNNQNALK